MSIAEWREMPMSVEDAARFDNSPCFICGYSGEQYYQPATHKCAAAFHAHHSDKSCEQALRERLRDTAAALAANVSTEVQSDCRWDQHGNCQAHYVESPCRVAEGRAILKRLKEEGLV